MRIDLQQLRKAPVTRDVELPSEFLGEDVEEDLRFDAATGDVTFRLLGDDVLATGKLHSRVYGPCARCLAEAGHDIDVDVLLNYWPRIGNEGSKIVDIDPRRARLHALRRLGNRARRGPAPAHRRRSARRAHLRRRLQGPLPPLRRQPERNRPATAKRKPRRQRNPTNPTGKKNYATSSSTERAARPVTRRVARRDPASLPRRSTRTDARTRRRNSSRPGRRSAASPGRSTSCSSAAPTPSSSRAPDPSAPSFRSTPCSAPVSPPDAHRAEAATPA